MSEIKDRLYEINEELSKPINERRIIVLNFDNSDNCQNCYLKGIQHALQYCLKAKDD